MKKIPYLIRFTKDQFEWLQLHSKRIGESMSTIIRNALNEYRNKVK